MEAYLPLLIQLIAGVAGSHIAARVWRSISIGLICNSMAGIIGGSAGGLVLGLIDGVKWAPSSPESMVFSSIAGFLGGMLMLGFVGGLRGIFEK